MADLPISIGLAVAEALDISRRRVRANEPPLAVDPKVAIGGSILDDLKARRLTVIAGAGVSYASGFPTWSQLLDRLATTLVPADQRAAFEVLVQRASPLVVARYLRQLLGVGGLFASRLHAALYGGSIDYGRPNGTLEFVLALAEYAGANDARLDILTYNFDDLVQARLATDYPGISFDTVVDEIGWRDSTATVRIGHVHGYLPSRPAGSPETWAEPVLAEDSFNSLMSDPTAWANQVQAQAYTHTSCLFVGLSMVDPNLRRLLDQARSTERSGAERRFAVLRAHAEGDSPFDGMVLNATTAGALNRIEVELIQSLGAELIAISGHHEYANLTAIVKGKP